MSKIKGNAATKAAPKKAPAPRQEFVEIADAIKDKRTSLASLCYDAAMMARKEKANEAELKLLKDVTTRQQWADMNKIICCAHKLPASAPKNLVKLAQYIRALDKGANASEAKQHAEGKINAGELQAKVAKRKGEPVPKPKDGKKGAQKRSDSENPWDMLKATMAAFQRQYGDEAELKEIFDDAYEALVLATAAADDVEEDEAA